MHGTLFELSALNVEQLSAHTIGHEVSTPTARDGQGGDERMEKE